METKYSTKELCEKKLKGISTRTFSNQPDKHLEVLRENYHVRIEKVGNAKFYYLTPKNTLANILNCNIGKRDINVIESILKIILKDEVVPVQPEYARVTGIAQSSISGYVNFLHKNNILIEHEIVKKPIYNQETGEILGEYEQKVGEHIYYDIQSDDTVYYRFPKEVQEKLHKTYQRSWAVELNKRVVPLQQNGTTQGQIMKVVGKIKRDIWCQINNGMKLTKWNRVMKPRINPDMEQQLRDYFAI